MKKPSSSTNTTTPTSSQPTTIPGSSARTAITTPQTTTATAATSRGSIMRPLRASFVFSRSIAPSFHGWDDITLQAFRNPPSPRRRPGRPRATLAVAARPPNAAERCRPLPGPGDPPCRSPRSIPPPARLWPLSPPIPTPRSKLASHWPHRPSPPGADARSASAPPSSPAPPGSWRPSASPWGACSPWRWASRSAPPSPKSTSAPGPAGTTPSTARRCSPPSPPRATAGAPLCASTRSARCSR